jgi:hypothetical protein
VLVKLCVANYAEAAAACGFFRELGGLAWVSDDQDWGSRFGGERRYTVWARLDQEDMKC